MLPFPSNARFKLDLDFLPASERDFPYASNTW